MNKILVWDFPTRAFHWMLVFAIAFSVYTGLDGGFNEMDYHMYSGFLILSLIIFRVAWGFLSHGNARFSRFVVSPKKILAYLHETKHYSGHNPLGALSVLSLLIILMVQTMTGLFANDDILVEGPLIHLVSDELSSQLTTIHHYSALCLGGLIALHLSAIVYHEIILKHKIVTPMITGRKSALQSAESGEIIQKEIVQHQQLLLALILFALSLTTVFTVVTYL